MLLKTEDIHPNVHLLYSCCSSHSIYITKGEHTEKSSSYRLNTFPVRGSKIFKKLILIHMNDFDYSFLNLIKKYRQTIGYLQHCMGATV